jgi:hypothetical protein
MHSNAPYYFGCFDAGVPLVLFVRREAYPHPSGRSGLWRLEISRQRKQTMLSHPNNLHCPLLRASVFYTVRGKGGDELTARQTFGPFESTMWQDILPVYWGVTECDAMLAAVPEDSRDTASIVFYTMQGEEVPDPRVYAQDCYDSV